MDKVEITGTNNGPIVTGGTNSGSISGGTIHHGPSDQVTGELIALLTLLRVEVGKAGVAKQEVIEDNLADLTTDARNPDEVIPAVVVSRWEKVKSLLSGTAQFTELIAKISEHVSKVFG
ncbi:hypothetical protein [Amycolatopsis sp. NPDC059657]|uniref:hypothetical protein n=1 Tax=Amycolatopsis sp. NPDC059657 TaxID=3346899 RepID=UPI00366E3BFB